MWYRNQQLVNIRMISIFYIIFGLELSKSKPHQEECFCYLLYLRASIMVSHPIIIILETVKMIRVVEVVLVVKVVLVVTHRTMFEKCTTGKFLLCCYVLRYVISSVFQAVRRDFSMLNCSYLGISSGLPGSQIDYPQYLVLIGIQSFEDPPPILRIWTKV